MTYDTLLRVDGAELDAMLGPAGLGLKVGERGRLKQALKEAKGLDTGALGPEPAPEPRVLAEPVPAPEHDAFAGLEGELSDMVSLKRFSIVQNGLEQF